MGEEPYHLPASDTAFQRASIAGGDWCGRPDRQNPRGNKMNILNEKF